MNNDSLFGLGFFVGALLCFLMLFAFVWQPIGAIEMLEHIRPCGKEISGATVEINQQTRFVCTFGKWREI